MKRWKKNRDSSAILKLPEPARSLAHELGLTLAGEVRFDAGSRGLYSTDASNYRQVPIGVVVPRTIEDVVATVRAARAHGVPILGRGCGTSLAGQCCNAAVVIDTSKYLNRVLEIDPEGRRARVQPGTILDDLRKAAARFDLTFGPDPATHNHCTLGGMIGNNSCGVHSVQAEFYGPGARTADNIEELEVLTYDGQRLRVGRTSEEELESAICAPDRRGEIYRRLKDLRDRHGPAIRDRFPAIPRRVSGYNLPQLLPENGFHLARALAGTESTCALTLEATVTLIPSPKARALVVLGYPTVYDAGNHIPRIRQMRPSGLEGLDDVLIDYVRKKGLHSSYVDLFPEGGGWLLVEFGGDSRNDARDRAREAMDRLQKEPGAASMSLYDHPEEVEKVWTVRESGLGATAFVPGEPDSWPGWEDSAVAPDRVGEYLHDLRALFKRYDYHCSLYGHFGEGCIHTRIDFDLRTSEGIKRYRDFTTEAAELVVAYGGSISGEHGDGQARGDLLQIMYGADLMQAFRDFKSAWDPEWKMNPGKVIEAAPRDRNLRLGADYTPAKPRTHFGFPEDGGDFSRAALRCVGVGECGRMDSGTMCPSFMVTREEKHSTRGRARLLFEMLQGEVIREGWQSEAVKEALDLCLACKGCKNDCPVSVDIATYKAEFLSHYYESRLRPTAAYAFGYIYRWARLASWMPELVNFVTQTPGLGHLAKWAAGVAQERQLPRFAPYTFRQHITQNYRRRQGSSDVILWLDTFNNHFHPETAEAALEVLEAAGYRVGIPRVALCCGRPLYDFGFLDTAKRLLREILDHLQPELESGTPIVVLEPSCAAVFRDELVNLFPQDENAKRLSQQTFLLSEFLEKNGNNFSVPQIRGKAIVQGHCHQKSLMGMESDARLFSQIGLEAEILDSGCCGMAGSFGFEAGERFDVSMKAGERVLLPAVRAAAADSVIIADGFSCREQIRQATGRQALHSAQVLQMALKKEFAHARHPEDDFVRRREIEHRSARRSAAVVLAAGAALVFLCMRSIGGLRAA
jgi:FAD/FMN-containing dehydrogenase/Fe-S oxidoreductase